MRIEADADCDRTIAEFVATHPSYEKDFYQLVGRRTILAKSGAAEQPFPSIPDFQFEDEIGRGGMGVVYRVKQVSLNRVVALKVCNGVLDPKLRSRFDREQQALAKLHHTNILPVYAAGREGRGLYFAMKYINGASFREVIQTARAHCVRSPSISLPSLCELSVMCVQQRTQKPPIGFEDLENSSQLRTAPLKLSVAYYQSIACGLADIADALHHAHQANVLHRDVKPANVMVDEAGTCWLIDFGLSRDRFGIEGKGETIPNSEESILNRKNSPTSNALTDDAVGTPCYIAPEQLQGHCDERSDIYSFGATLYEALALRPSFEETIWKSVVKKGEPNEPMPLEQLVPGIPRDLAAICRKSMKLKASERYSTAAEIAADLRRWMAHEPTQANPVGLFRRFSLWSRRNKSLATSLVSMAVGALLLLVMVSLWWQSELTRASGAIELAESRLLDGLLQQTLHQRSQRPHEGWRTRSLELIATATQHANSISKTARIRNEAAASLTGLDARKLKDIVRDSSSVAFDATGKRVLASGWSATNGKHMFGALMLDLENDSEQKLGRLGNGPVAFQPDGSPVQLTWNTPQKLELWNVEQDRLIHQWLIRDSLSHPVLAHSPIALTILSPDGLYSVTALSDSDDQGVVLVWNNTSGVLVCSLPCNATAMAISPNNSMLAIGQADGQVRLWSVRDGELISVMKNNDKCIYALDFSNDTRLDESIGTLRPHGRLVIGDSGSLATVRDIESGDAVCHLRGSDHWVLAARFSPDGQRVATGGIGLLNIWSVNNGELLITLKMAYPVTDLHFSRDGSRLAATSVTTFTPGHISIWEFENGRGVSEFHGLNSQVTQSLLSFDDSLLAAMSHDGEIALWEQTTGRLRFCLRVPHADYVENTQIAFSLDGSTLYYAGQQALIAWRTDTGEVTIGPIEWNQALGNKFAFPQSGEVLVLRYETQNGKLMPDNRSERSTDPRVFRVYCVNGTTPQQPLHELCFSDRSFADPRVILVDQAASPDGSSFVVDAYLTSVDSPREEGERFVKMFDSVSGRELFSVQSPSKAPARSFRFPIQSRTASGQTLMILFDNGKESRFIVREPTGEILNENRVLRGEVDVKVTDCLMNSHGTIALEGKNVHFVDGERILASFQMVASDAHGFSASGDYWIGSANTGTVRVYDSNRIRRELTQLRLGW